MMFLVGDKQQALTEVLEQLNGVVVAYSGGVDSACLAAFAHEVLGDRSLAVTAVSPAVARRELDDAITTARARGFAHVVVNTHEMQKERYVRNAPDRCFWCKTELFDVLAPIARQRRAHMITGTNVDDLGDYRPGLRAARSHGVVAPFVEAGMTKADVRGLARALGLKVADKPASPCLASRLAYGVAVTPERLRRVDAAEDELRRLGFSIVRVRDHGDLARVEVASDEIDKAAALADEISRALRSLGFSYVTLDLAGFRSGSLNETLTSPQIRRA